MLFFIPINKSDKSHLRQHGSKPESISSRSLSHTVYSHHIQSEISSVKTGRGSEKWRNGGRKGETCRTGYQLRNHKGPISCLKLKTSGCKWPCSPFFPWHNSIVATSWPVWRWRERWVMCWTHQKFPFSQTSKRGTPLTTSSKYNLAMKLGHRDMLKINIYKNISQVLIEVKLIFFLIEHNTWIYWYSYPNANLLFIV